MYYNLIEYTEMRSRAFELYQVKALEYERVKQKKKTTN